VCVSAVYHKAQAQGISNREFKLWTFLQETESRVATFHAETCVVWVCVCVCVCMHAHTGWVTDLYYVITINIVKIIIIILMFIFTDDVVVAISNSGVVKVWTLPGGDVKVSQYYIK